ncbi:MAG: 3-dehydroquinate synthase, partial [Candidatus Sericytochromatia bacterium]|nr:3-dehydroquinate synthase [Candidatus Tanganyikabacteria bacterium]
LPPDRLVAAMATDKKVADGRVSWVLPTAIGSVTVRDDVSPADVTRVLGKDPAGRV